MADVLTPDSETTPITPAASEGHYCDLCEHAPFRTAGGLAGHRAGKHGVTGAKRPPKAPAAAKGQAKPLARRLEQSFGLIGVGVCFIEPYDGRCIVVGARQLGDSLAELADAYPETRKYIEAICLDSPALGVIIATLPVLLPIMKHHGIIKMDLPPAFAGPAAGKAAKPEAEADAGAEPASPAAAPDLVAMMTELGPSMAAAMQASAAAPRPMGEGAPPAAGPGPKGRRPAAGSPAADPAPSAAGDGEPT
jgi:hypothetical protein